MSTHFPGRNTSGARPLTARGSETSSIRGPKVIFLRFPGIALVEAQARIAARACRAAKADFAPRRRVRIINRDDLLQEMMEEEAAGGQVAPVAALDAVVLDVGQKVVLLGRDQLFEAFAVPVARLGGDGGEPLPPGVAHRRHVSVAVTGRMIVVEHVVDPRNDRHRLLALGLRQEPRDNCFEQRPLLLGQEATLRYVLEALPDG